MRSPLIPIAFPLELNQDQLNWNISYLHNRINNYRKI